MRRSLLALSLLVPACAPPGAPSRPPAALAAPAPRPALECSTFSLLVNRDVATAAAVDPVETQMAIMRSRAFLSGAPTWLAPSGIMSLERTGKSALITVRIEAQPTRAGVVCDWLERRTLEMARSERAAGSAWLSEQLTTLQHDADARQEELSAFDKQNDLLSVSLADQIEQLRAELKAQRAQHRSAASDLVMHSLTERAMQLNLQEIARNRLLARANGAARLLDAVRERLAAAQLDDQLDHSLAVLDPCAPCPAR